MPDSLEKNNATQNCATRRLDQRLDITVRSILNTSALYSISLE